MTITQGCTSSTDAIIAVHSVEACILFVKKASAGVTVAMAEVAASTLANIPLDVQISICLFLHPSDILALRKVCRQRCSNQ